MTSTNGRDETGAATLLVVDDDASARELLREVLAGGPHRVVVAPDAPRALRLLHRESCDLILLDVEMPGIDGLALCRLLRAQPATKRLPIVVVSARDDEERKVAAFAAGADDFISKSAPRGELLSRVTAHLEASRRERALVGSNRELGFLADLGRGLLVALEPLQVVRRAAGATYEAANASLCAAVLLARDGDELGESAAGGSRADARDARDESAETETKSAGEANVAVKANVAAGVNVFDDAGVAACVFDREGSAEGSRLIRLDRLRRWLASGPQAAMLLEDAGEFLLRDEEHAVEYVAPLRFGGRTAGALVAAFDVAGACGETESRLVDAAAQQVALAAHVSSLYEAARASSVSLAREVERRTAEAVAQRRFTEAIIDSLPVSLYATILRSRSTA